MSNHSQGKPKRGKAAKAPPGPHIIWRAQKSGPARAYGDFRGFPGGSREALIAPGERSATTDHTTAQEVFAKRLRILENQVETYEAARPNGKRTTLVQGVTGFLEWKRGRKRATDKWCDSLATMLGRAVEHFGATRRLVTITPDEVVKWLDSLARATHPRGTGYSDQSRRHHLNALGQVFKRGQRAGWVPAGFSPTTLLDAEERPAIPASSTGWLEVPDAARLLEAARIYPRLASEPRMVLAYPILATFLLTGGRADEVLGLEVGDIDFASKVVRFRATPYRRGKKGKTAAADRVVPLFPQLESILREYLGGTYLDMQVRRPSLTLLFPSPLTLGRITDIRDMVDKPAARAGLPVGVFRQREFRVTYITARLQTLDRGEPIAPWTVAKEVGHSSMAMIERVYGRLGAVRQRVPVVEYRVVPRESANTSEQWHPLVPVGIEEMAR